MNENINLCEILKGYEGETFYSPIYGNVSFIGIFKIQNEDKIKMSYCYFNKHGQFAPNGELMIFPSKDQRDWNKWVEEQKHKVPKTWSEIKNCNAEVWGYISQMNHGVIEPILKSALALLKIHQLIEAGYGGNTDKAKEFYSVSYDVQDKKIYCS